jgi:hypothetical protein
MQRFLEKMYGLLLVAVVLLTSGSIAVAQSYYGTLKGSVVDSQGAAIAGATVELMDVSTRIKRTAITNGSGEYVISAIDPSTFDLTVQAANFQTSTRKGIVIATQQTITIDTKLTIGQTSETVEVSAAAPLIDTSTASNGQIFDTQKLTDLPNLGRNAFLLAKLNNNVTATGDPRFNRFQDQSGSSAISVGGGPISGNNYEIDGVPITDFSNRAVIIPSVDAVQEMKIQTNTYDAEMGRTGGGNFNTLLKSGTNRLHGNLLGTTRQTNWQANTWANNFSNAGRSPQTQYTYEGSIGGPIWKDRAFFWLTEEGYRQLSPLTGSFFLPTAQMLQGNFAGVSRTIYDPNNLVNGVRQAFPGNIIPASRISAVGRAIANNIPACGAGCTPTTTYGSTNFNRTDTLSDRADEFIGKLDFKLTSKWTANISYMHYGSKEPSGNTLGTATYNANNLFRKVDATTVNTVYELSPTSVLTVGFGYNRFPNFSADISQGYDQTQLGFNSTYVSSLQKAAFPTISSQSLPSLGGGSSGFSVFYSRNFVVGYQKSLGRHSLKAGYVYRSISVDFTNVGNGNGTFTFNRNYTAADNTGASGGADLADMLLGLPVSSTVQTATKLAINVPYNAFYLQDDYRLSSRLTINGGIRYEHEAGSHERNNNYAVGFDTNVTNPLSATGREAKGGIMFAGTNGYGNSSSTYANKIAPRLGAVFSLNEKTVLRGGYGIFWAPIPYNASANLAPGFTAVTTYTASASTYSTAYNLANPFPTINRPVGNTLGYAQGNGDTLTTIQAGRNAPWVQQYSIDIQRQLPYGVALEVGYVGAKGTNLIPGNGTTYNLNQINPSAIPAGTGPCPAGTTIANIGTGTVTNPYSGNGGTGVIAGANVSRSQLCKPFPTFNAINVQPSSSRSVYNSFILKAQKSMAKGVTALVTYTYSQNSDSTFGTSSNLNVGNNGPANIYNLDGEYSRAINDIPQRLALSTTYQLPFGRGKAYLSSNRWLDLIVGGWSANGTFIGQVGGPVPIKQDNNVNSVLGAAQTRPNLVPGINPCTDGSVQSRNGQSAGAKLFLNPAAFQTVPVGTFGNSPRTIPGCRAPGYRNLDASLFKDFKQWEKVTFQFRAEFMNLTNTPQFALTAANLNVGNGAFGQVPVGAINFPRLITLGGKIMF